MSAGGGPATPVAASWLYGVLAGDTGAGGVATLVGGRVYDSIAPLGTSLPFVVFQFASGVPLLTLSGEHVWSSLRYVVKAVGLGASAVPLQPIVARAHALLHRRQAAVAAGSVYACLFDGEICYPEYDRKASGVVYTHLGAYYEIKARAA